MRNKLLCAALVLLAIPPAAPAQFDVRIEIRHQPHHLNWGTAAPWDIGRPPQIFEAPRMPAAPVFINGHGSEPFHFHPQPQPRFDFRLRFELPHYQRQHVPHYPHFDPRVAGGFAADGRPILGRVRNVVNAALSPPGRGVCPTCP